MAAAEPTPTRRPLKTRNTRWAGACARALIGLRLRPNQISVASIAFAAGAGICFWYTARVNSSTIAWLLVAAALLIQVRLLCNLFDGMVAVEGGFKTKSGEIFNELPDRFADAFILIGAGYVVPKLAWMPLLGWAAAILAVTTAYVRALGASAGASQQFCGPMAKPHRMAVITVASLGNAVLLWCRVDFALVGWALIVIAAGCVVTIIRRTLRIIGELECK
jgi:phosphatidylglycerophosphate synthase